jgi:hypothetical protein
LLQGFKKLYPDGQLILREILNWTNGHPFLTQKICNDLAINPISVDNVKDQVRERVIRLFLSPEIHNEPNLSNVNNRILKNSAHNSEMLSTYQRILAGEMVKSNYRSLPEIYLRLSGLVVSRNTYLETDNLIYKTYFNEEWLTNAFRLIDRPFAEAMQRWSNHGKSVDTALRGSALDEYADWAGQRNDLSPLEHEFLEFSWKIQQKENKLSRKRLIWVITSLLFLVAVALAFGGMALYQKNMANRAQQSADEAKVNAEIAERAAKNLQKQAEAASDTALYQKNLATLQKLEAEKKTIEAEKEREKKADALAKLKSEQENKQNAILALNRQVVIAGIAMAERDTLAAIIDIQPFITRAKDILPQNPTIALRLAEHAFRLKDIDSTRALLYRILADPKNWFYCEGFVLPERKAGYHARFSDNGRFIASLADGPVVVIHDAARGNLLNKYTVPFEAASASQVLAWKFSPDSAIIMVVAANKKVRLVDVTKGDVLKTLRGQQDAISAASFSMNGKLLATGYNNGKIKIWDVESPALLDTMNCAHPVRNVNFSQNGEKLIVTAEHSPVTIWDIRTKHPLSEFKTDRTKSATCAIFSPNERLIAISYDITGVAPFSYVEVWDAFSHKLLYILKGHTNFVRSVAFSSDGTKLVTASLDFTARIWNLQTLRDQKSIVDAYRNGLPFEEVRDIIEKFLRSGGVASFSEEQRKLYSIGQHSNLP